MGLRKFIENKAKQHQANVERDRAFNQKLREKERQGFEDSALLAAERKGRIKGRDYGSRDNSFSARLSGNLEAFSAGANHASNAFFGSPPGNMASNIDVFQNPQGFGMSAPTREKKKHRRESSPYDWMYGF
jgi:hypothetical protein